MRVEVPGVHSVVTLEAGEELRTEISAKFRPESVQAELAAAGLVVLRQWNDRDGRYVVTLARAQADREPRDSGSE